MRKLKPEEQIYVKKITFPMSLPCKGNFFFIEMLSGSYCIFTSVEDKFILCKKIIKTNLLIFCACETMKIFFSLHTGLK